MTIRKRDVRIPVGEIHLEGILGYADERAAGPGVLICHPHPQFGGSMDNNVVWALFDVFTRRGYVAVAFNFRGVGRSGGRHEDGEGEILDVKGVLDWLEELPETKGFGLGMLGYSFGAWVGLRAAAKEERVHCVGAVAPPVSMYSFTFLSQLRSPLYVVSGSKDPFCSADQKDSLFEGPRDDRDWKVLEGADHFFWNHEQEAAQYLCDAFSTHLPTPALAFSFQV